MPDQLIKLSVSTFAILENINIVPNTYTSYYLPPRTTLTFKTNELWTKWLNNSEEQYSVNVELKKIWGEGFIYYEFDENTKEQRYLDFTYLLSKSHKKTRSIIILNIHSTIKHKNKMSFIIEYFEKGIIQCLIL